jgi:hypothetical protein
MSRRRPRDLAAGSSQLRDTPLCSPDCLRKGRRTVATELDDRAAIQCGGFAAVFVHAALNAELGRRGLRHSSARRRMAAERQPGTARTLRRPRAGAFLIARSEFEPIPSRRRGVELTERSQTRSEGIGFYCSRPACGRWGARMRDRLPVSILGQARLGLPKRFRWSERRGSPSLITTDVIKSR